MGNNDRNDDNKDRRMLTTTPASDRAALCRQGGLER